MIKKIISTILIGLISFLIFKGGTYFNFIYGKNVEKQGYIYIQKKDSYKDVIKKISPHLKNINSFKWVAKLKNYPNKIKAGKYYIEKNLNNNNLINKLRSGNQETIKLKFGGERNLDEFILHITRQLDMNPIDLKQALFDPSFLNKNNITKESHFLELFIANTYYVYWTISPKSLIDLLIKEHQKFWNEERKNKIKKLDLTLSKVIILSSIIQKETSMVNEMPIVAGLFLNRLKKNWKLESCATIVYAIKEKSKIPINIKQLFYKDLKIDSTYNTYLYNGLPPGPICFPEISAIDALLNPSIHNYYFMIVDLEKRGYHKFSYSKEDHEVKKKIMNYLRDRINEKKEY